MEGVFNWCCSCSIFDTPQFWFSGTVHVFRLAPVDKWSEVFQCEIADLHLSVFKFIAIHIHKKYFAESKVFRNNTILFCFFFTSNDHEIMQLPYSAVNMLPKIFCNN